MTQDCGHIREWIPDVAAGRASDDAARTVEAHAAGCGDCRAELALARALFDTRPRIPGDAAGPVLGALRRDRSASRRSSWGLAAAAVAALALGIGISSGPGVPAGNGDDVLDEVAEEELWLSDDGVVAGAPMIETLSDEALEQLLDELTATTPGGQA